MQFEMRSFDIDIVFFKREERRIKGYFIFTKKLVKFEQVRKLGTGGIVIFGFIIKINRVRNEKGRKKKKMKENENRGR